MMMHRASSNGRLQGSRISIRLFLVSIFPAVVYGASSTGCNDSQAGLTPLGNPSSTPNEPGLQCNLQSAGNTTYLSCWCNTIGLENEICLTNVDLTSVSHPTNTNWVLTEPNSCLSNYLIPKSRPGSASQSPGNIALLTTFTAIIYFFVKALFMNRPVDKHGYPIPYGPIGLPILGSFPFLTRYPELTLDYWAKKFGPLYSLWLGNQLFIVVSDPHIAKDLMVTNGAIFSSRKEMFLKSKTIFAGREITATPYNETWRKHRRIAASFLVQKAVDGYTNVLDYEATVLVRELFTHSQAGNAPINPQPHAGRCSLNNMLTIVFGTRTDSINHPLVNRALRLSREFMNCTGPVSNLTDFIPLLQNIPNYMTLRGKQLHKDLVETYGGMILDIDKRMKLGEKVPDCLVKTMLEEKGKEQLDHIDMSILCAAFMIGGVETTASIMQWFSALIPAYPEIQAKAQAELDRVVGRDRLPSVEDEKNMPYIHAIVKEVERCHNPFWLGTPHVNTQDFTYRGQFIPQNTVVVLNTYTMHHDPTRHPDPHTFNPDRYIDDSTSSSESANLVNACERDHWMFGAGRRICPGMWVAEREIWLAISRMLWAFKMEEIPGEPIDLKEYDGLSGRSPVPFRIMMIPRHEKVKEVLGLLR